MSVYDSMDESKQFACRVIADHARATAFAIADGILPGNEGRNYVLRKIMRRAIYHGREHLGLNDAFFYKVCDLVVENYRGAYPELETQRDFIGKMVRLEEERFANTLSAGLGRFSDIDQFIDSVRDEELELENDPDLSITIDLPLDPQPKRSFILTKDSKLKAVKLTYPDGTVVMEDPSIVPPGERSELELKHREIRRVLDAQRQFLVPNLDYLKDFREALKNFPTIPAEVAESLRAIRPFLDNVHRHELFKKLASLYDTFGVPKDLMRVKLEENGVEFSEEEFAENLDAAVQELQKQSNLGKTERKSQISPIYADVLQKVGRNEFHGYEVTEIDDAKIVAILDGEREVDVLPLGATGGIVLDRTPFYAESGGQVGDQGLLHGIDKNARVTDTFSPIPGLVIHKAQVRVGEFRVGDVVRAEVNVDIRDATRRNHTATHLVHAALKEVLGSHVKQAGSVVAPNYLRFDFTHYQPMTAAEIAEVEDLVNHYILKNEPVTTNMMALEDAMRSGAVAMFGEKYGSEVRVLSVGGGEFSRELCGGTHVRATGDIGSFKITSDEAIASGVRRIRAVTGFDAFERFREDERLIDASLAALNTQRDNLPNAIARMQEELKKTRKEMDELKLKIALGGQGSAGSGQSSNGDEARDIAGIKVLAKIIEGLDANGTRQLSDTLLSRLKSGVVVLGRRDDGKVGIIVRVSDDLTSKVKAGDVIRAIAPIVGGKGGGKPDMAEGGGSQPEKLSEAIDAAYAFIERSLK